MTVGAPSLHTRTHGGQPLLLDFGPIHVILHDIHQHADPAAVARIHLAAHQHDFFGNQALAHLCVYAREDGQLHGTAHVLQGAEAHRFALLGHNLLDLGQHADQQQRLSGHAGIHSAALAGHQIADIHGYLLQRM